MGTFLDLFVAFFWLFTAEFVLLIAMQGIDFNDEFWYIIAEIEINEEDYHGNNI